MTLEATPATPTTASKTVYVTCEVLNVRSGASVGNFKAEIPGSGRCAFRVHRALDRHYGTDLYGDAKQNADALRATGLFGQLNVTLEEALKIPGAVLNWQEELGSAGKLCGHTAISVGNGTDSICDYYESNTMKFSSCAGFTCFVHKDYV